MRVAAGQPPFALFGMSAAVPKNAKLYQRVTEREVLKTGKIEEVQSDSPVIESKQIPQPNMKIIEFNENKTLVNGPLFQAFEKIDDFSSGIFGYWLKIVFILNITPWFCIICGYYFFFYTKDVLKDDISHILNKLR